MIFDDEDVDSFSESSAGIEIKFKTTEQADGTFQVDEKDVAELCKVRGRFVEAGASVEQQLEDTATQQGLPGVMLKLSLGDEEGNGAEGLQEGGLQGGSDAKSVFAAGDATAAAEWLAAKAVALGPREGYEWMKNQLPFLLSLNAHPAQFVLRLICEGVLERSTEQSQSSSKASNRRRRAKPALPQLKLKLDVPHQLLLCLFFQPGVKETNMTVEEGKSGCGQEIRQEIVQEPPDGSAQAKVTETKHSHGQAVTSDQRLAAAGVSACAATASNVSDAHGQDENSPAAAEAAAAAANLRELQQLALRVLAGQIYSNQPAETEHQHGQQPTSALLAPAELSPKAIEAVITAFGLTGVQVMPIVVQIAQQSLQGQAYRKLLDIVQRFSLYQNFEPSEYLLPLVKERAFDAVVRCCCHTSLEKDMASKLQRYSIEAIAESNLGDNPTLAYKLIKRWKYSDSEFPRVVYLKKKNALWFFLSIGKFTDFSDILCGELTSKATRSSGTGDGGVVEEADEWQHKLRQYACRQLYKNRNAGDMALFHVYVRAYGLENEDEFAQMLQQKEPSPPPPSASSSSPAGGTAVSQQFLTMANTPVVWVDSENAAKAAQRTLSCFLGGQRCAEEKELQGEEEEDQKEMVVGLDLEFVPDLLQDFHVHSTSCQVLQVSSVDSAFLFDLQVIRACPSMQDLLAKLFANPQVVKVGIGFAADLAKLGQDFADLPSRVFSRPIYSYCELSALPNSLPRRFWCEQEQRAAAEADISDAGGGRGRGRMSKKVQRGVGLASNSNACGSVPPPRHKKKEGGLSKLARLCLGSSLDKTEQISNWSLRPLRHSQLQYAALDALCEVLIYRHLKRASFPGLNLQTLEL